MLSRVFNVDPVLGAVQFPGGHCHAPLTRAYLQEAKVCKLMGFKRLHSWRDVINQQWATKYVFCEAFAKVIEERSTAEQ